MHEQGNPVTTKRRIYLASSWRNAFQPTLVDALRGNGHEVYDFRNPSAGYDNPTGVTRGFQWSEIDPNWHDWTVNGYLAALRHNLVGKGFESDWRGMQWADTCVLLLPSGRSAHIEAGYFVGARKQLHILMMEKQEPELMYLMATSISRSLAELWVWLANTAAGTAS